MPTYQALLPESIYSSLDRMSELYSAVEKDMHVALMRGDKIAALEKSLQAKYQVDSTTTRNVYHNLKGKHQSIKELRKTQIKDLKSTIKSIQSAIKKRLKKKRLTQKDRFIIHQKKRRLAIKKQKLEKLLSSDISLCFGTKKLFKAQFNLEANGYSSHDEWLADWRKARTSSFMMVGAKTYASGNQLCRLNSDGNLKITVPPCLLNGHIKHLGFPQVSCPLQYRNFLLGLTAPAGLTKAPQISLPYLSSEQAPWGVSLMALSGCDRALLACVRKLDEIVTTF